MPKMEAASLTMKISLAQIVDTGNIREVKTYGPDYKGEYPPEIIELAQSIKTVGQLQPVNVKMAVDNDGDKQYELIAGFRRRAAFQYLCSTGEDYNQIDARIVTGDKLTIQLIENIQREDLSAQEREKAISQLAESGMKQTEIAAQISKSKSFVSVNISAYKIRKKAFYAGIDLTGVETSTLAEFLSVPDDELLMLLKKLMDHGGTRAAASVLTARFKRGKETPPPEDTTTPDIAPVTPINKDEPPSDDIDPLKDHDNNLTKAPPKKPQPKPIKSPPPDDDYDEPIEAEHREVDVNIVLTVIYDYIKQLENLKPETDMGKTMMADKAEAAKDIMALILKRLDDV